MKTYDKQKNYSEGLAAVNVGYKEKITNQTYDPREGPYHEIVSEGKWGYINENGNEVIPILYDKAESFSGGIALVKLNNDFFFIDTNGNRLFDFIYDTISPFHEGLAYVKKSNKYGFINTKGEEIIPLIYNSVLDFSLGLAPVMPDHLWGFINTKNELVIPPRYNYATMFHQGLALVQLNGKFGCIDNKGSEIFTCQYDEISLKKIGLVEVKQNNKYIYFNFQGNQLSKPYDYSNNFYTGTYCVVGIGGTPLHNLNKIEGAKWGVIDKNGAEVVPLNYNTYTEAAEHMKKLPQV